MASSRPGRRGTSSGRRRSARSRPGPRRTPPEPTLRMRTTGCRRQAARREGGDGGRTEPPAGTILTVSPTRPSPGTNDLRVGPRIPGARSPPRTGVGAGVTRRVETTDRWSDGQGSTAMSVPSYAASPTTALASALIGPGVQDPVDAVVDLHAFALARVARRPGEARVGHGVGWTSRYESTEPALARERATGQTIGYGTSTGRAAETAAVQSRCDGELKSPVRTTGIPTRRAAADRRWGWMAGIRSSCSRARTSSSVQPSRGKYGPYGSDGRWTLARAITRPGAISA